MPQFIAQETGMKVNGTTINSVIDGMGAFKAVAIKKLEEAGLANIETSADKWYSQQAWLDAFKNIFEEIGKNTLKNIGKMIPENAQLPPDIDSANKALQSIDVAYHMNHQNANGEVLFDPTRDPAMLEGIGHYKYIPGSTAYSASIICDHAYPCDFDIGLIIAFAERFATYVNLIHGESCRKDGAKECKYDITWHA